MRAASLEARLYALDEDLQARGIGGIDGALAEAVDYPAFVALSLKYDKVNSWL
ncbi:Protein TusB [compost metagenome]